MAIPPSRGETDSHGNETDDSHRNETECEDDASDDDMEALRRACKLTGINPNDLNATTTATKENAAATTSVSDSDGESSDFDDIEFVRSLRQRFSIPSDDVQPLVLQPLRTLPPGFDDDDDEDDFETLRAIERRFAKYESDALKRNTRCSTDKAESVCDENTTLEQGTANTFSVDKDLEMGLDEELPSSEEAPETSQPMESPVDMDLGSRPSGSNSVELDHQESFEPSTSSSKYSRFPDPKSAHMFIDAIKRNRSCQRFIRSKLIQIEARIEENKKLKEHIKLVKDYQMSCKRRAGRAFYLKRDPHILLIQAQKSRNSQTSKVSDKKVRASNFGPVENSHAAVYRMVLTRFPVLLHKQKWSKSEKENLGKGIKQQFQEMLLQRSLELLSVSEESLGDSHAFDEAIASITNLEITPEQVRSFIPKVDWERLASTYLPGRSGPECEARWLNCEDPLINDNSWSKDEDKNLLFILQNRGLHNWIEIASSLGTNRTPFQCLSRYQRSLNAFILKRDWTNEDDSQLRAAVETFGEHNWQLVASNLEGRTGTQCSNRWNKTLNPIRERVGRWTVEEDKCLKVAVMLFGAKSWNKIAQFVPGRTQVQCRERWVNVLDPSLNLGAWTEEEDCKLKEAISKHGHCWFKVAACVPPRTDNQCRRRWKVLLPHEVPVLQAARRIQKAALISNFVDREEERPALGPEDFLPLPWNDSASASDNGAADATKNDIKTRSKSKKQKDLAYCSDSSKIRQRRRRHKASNDSQGRSSVMNGNIESCGKDKICSRRVRHKAKTQSQDASRVMNGDLESPGANEAITQKKMRRKSRQVSNCAQSAHGKQDLQISSEPSAISRIASSHDDNIIWDNISHSKRMSKLQPRRRKSKHIEMKNKDPILPSDSVRMSREGNADTLGQGMVKQKYTKRRKKDPMLSSGNPNFVGISSEGNADTLCQDKVRHNSTKRKTKDPVPFSENPNSARTSSEDNADTSKGSSRVKSWKRRIPKMLLEYVRHSESVPAHEEPSFSPESAPLMRIPNGHDAETSGVYNTILKKRKVLKSRSRKREITEPTQDHQNLLLHEEGQSTIDDRNVALSGLLPIANIPPEDTFVTTAKDATERFVATMGEDNETLISFLQNKGRMNKKFRRANKNKATSNKVIMPCSRKCKNIEAGQAEDFSTLEEQFSFDGMDVTSNGMMTMTAIVHEDTLNITGDIVSHSKEIFETTDADEQTLASFLHKKARKRRNGNVTNDKVASPPARKRRKKGCSDGQITVAALIASLRGTVR